MSIAPKRLEILSVNEVQCCHHIFGLQAIDSLNNSRFIHDKWSDIVQMLIPSEIILCNPYLIDQEPFDKFVGRGYYLDNDSSVKLSAATKGQFVYDEELINNPTLNSSDVDRLERLSIHNEDLLYQAVNHSMCHFIDCSEGNLFKSKFRNITELESEIVSGGGKLVSWCHDGCGLRVAGSYEFACDLFQRIDAKLFDWIDGRDYSWNSDLCEARVH